ncbi:AraC family transcriptional regulator [Rhizobium sp. TRM95111]|uniref:AraC family transcriptional regulator n=1 Tax=Rhizobium alarense TaxID=2846851 RepID=UPI001F3E489E|nr:AraC family transcriptional regulator [Rhizobium alarense]MCF3640305.1 AraC family transcriptional regulator [Rhizobium alarense]
MRWNKGDHLSLVGTNPRELSTAFSRLLPATAVVPGGREGISYDIHMFCAGAVSIIASSYEGDLTVRFPGLADKNMVIIPLAGSALITVGKRQMLSEGDRGVIADGLLENQIRINGLRKHLCLRISNRELIRRLAVRLNSPIRERLDFAPEIDLSGGAGLGLARLAAMMHSGLADGTLRKSPVALGNLSDAVIELLIEAVPHAYSHELCRSVEPPLPRHVKRAIDYMHANISRVITLDEIADACGVSARTLQGGFREFRMTTPIAYLQHLRLDAARKELLLGELDASVKAVARKWGFAHMGRFSAQYRDRFGEFPSHTIRKIGGGAFDGDK